jgi:hypothetical protein
MEDYIEKLQGAIQCMKEKVATIKNLEYSDIDRLVMELEAELENISRSYIQKVLLPEFRSDIWINHEEKD